MSATVGRRETKDGRYLCLYNPACPVYSDMRGQECLLRTTVSSELAHCTVAVPEVQVHLVVFLKFFKLLAPAEPQFREAVQTQHQRLASAMPGRHCMQPACPRTGYTTSSETPQVRPRLPPHIADSELAACTQCVEMIVAACKREQQVHSLLTPSGTLFGVLQCLFLGKVVNGCST